MQFQFNGMFKHLMNTGRSAYSKIKPVGRCSMVGVPGFDGVLVLEFPSRQGGRLPSSPNSVQAKTR
jgi:hypothetical protein